MAKDPTESEVVSEETPVEMSPLEFVLESRRWYKANFRRALVFSSWSALANVILLVLVIVGFVIKSEPRYFAVTQDFQLIQSPPLDEPYVTDAGVKQFAARTVADALSFHFLNYKKSFNDIKHSFSPKGFNGFQKQMVGKGWLQLVTENNYILHSFVPQAPVVKNKYRLNNQVTWVLEMPLTATLQTQKGRASSEDKIVELVVQRCDLKDNPRGIWVDRMIVN